MTSFSGLEALTESVRDSQLPVTFRWEGQRQLTIHTQGSSRRAKQNQEIWAHMRTLGQGGFGTVELQAREPMSNRTGDKQFRAVKTIRVTEEELSNNREFYARELEAIIKFSQAKHGELFVKSFGWFTSESSLHIAMEYCELGDLQKFLLKNCKNRRLPEDQTHDIASQVLDALATMHEERFAHRDLKPANILIKSHPPDHPWAVKVADFGISRRDQDSTTTVRGTSTFMPPELLGISSHNARAVDLFAADMWCYGETIYRILTGDGAFQSLADLFAYYHGSTQFPMSPLEALNVSDSIIEFLRSLLVCNPVKRLTATAALDHAWMETDSFSPNTGSRDTYSYNATNGSGHFPVHDTAIKPLEETGESEASASWTDNFSQLTVNKGQSATHQSGRQDGNTVSKFNSPPTSRNVPRYEISEGVVANAKRRLATMEENLIKPKTSFGYSSTLGELTSPTVLQTALQGKPTLVSLRRPKISNEVQIENTDASLPWPTSTQVPNTVRHTQPLPLLDPPQHQNTQTQTVNQVSRGKMPIESISKNSNLNSSDVSPDSLNWNMPHKDHRDHGKLLSDHDLKLLSIQGDKAQESLKTRDFNTARDLYERHWDTLKDRLGEEHPRTILALASLVKALEKLNRYEEMELFCRNLINVRSKTIGPHDKMTFYSWRLLARCLMCQGRLQESVSIYTTVIESCKRIGDDDEYFKSLESLEFAYLERGRLDQAEATFKELIKIKEERLGNTHELLLGSIYRYSIGLKDVSKRHDLALPIAQQFFSVVESIQATGAPLTATTRMQLQGLSWAKSAVVSDSTNGLPNLDSYGGSSNRGSATSTPATTANAGKYYPPKKSKSSRLRGLFS